MNYTLSLSRLLAIIDNDGFDATRSERKRMAIEIVELRDRFKNTKWDGVTGGAGHGDNDDGLNPLTQR